MAKQITKKLHSNRGASMTLALVLMLMCVMVSSVILAAAASGSSRNVDRTESQREYLAVSSAANLVAEELEKIGTFSGERTVSTYGCEKYDVTEPVEHGGVMVTGYRITDGVIIEGAREPIIIVDEKHSKVIDATSSYTATESSALGDIMYDAAASIYSGSSSYEQKFQITPESEDERIPEVNCTFKMNDSYGVSVVITAKDGDYTITVIMAKDNQNTIVKDNITISCEHLVYFRQKSGDEYIDGEKSDCSISGQKVNTTDEITWRAPEILKGGNSE